MYTGQCPGRQNTNGRHRSKFFSLMELMASASREASSLKEVWAKLIAERESWADERNELMEQVTEFSTQLETVQADRHRHTDESVEGKKKVEKLLLDMSIAVAGITAEKKKVADRDHELGTIRRQLVESQEIVTRHHTGMLLHVQMCRTPLLIHQTDLERTRAEHETLTLALATAESERHTARDEADRLQRELSKVVRERTEISSRITGMANVYLDFFDSRSNMLTSCKRHHHEI